MTDYFLLLEMPRQPWISLELLKEHFLKSSAQLHPDRFHDQPPETRATATQNFSEVNAAYACLRNPKDRLRHLLELERGAKPTDIQSVPQNLMNLFFEVGQILRQVDAYSKQNEAVSSPILKVKQFEQRQTWVDKITQVQNQINAQREQLINELQTIPPDWKEQWLNRLEEMYRLFGYYDKWIAQLQERISRLNFADL